MKSFLLPLVVCNGKAISQGSLGNWRFLHWEITHFEKMECSSFICYWPTFENPAWELYRKSSGLSIVACQVIIKMNSCSLYFRVIKQQRSTSMIAAFVRKSSQVVFYSRATWRLIILPWWTTTFQQVAAMPLHLVHPPTQALIRLQSSASRVDATANSLPAKSL